MEPPELFGAYCLISDCISNYNLDPENGTVIYTDAMLGAFMKQEDVYIILNMYWFDGLHNSSPLEQTSYIYQVMSLAKNNPNHIVHAIRLSASQNCCKLSIAYITDQSKIVKFDDSLYLGRAQLCILAQG